jgi:hypothetical protein
MAVMIECRSAWRSDLDDGSCLDGTFKGLDKSTSQVRQSLTDAAVYR